jgi:NAD(P)-dependent dehydrogenase (short-subunit alcohol dehydrogenase family)
MTTFVITGSTKGIGFALAKYCVRRGHAVVISGRTPETVAQAVAALQKEGGAGRVLGLATDVSDASQVEALWSHAVTRFGRVDVWINNAGVANTTRKIVDTPAADVRNMVTTNMLGTLHGCQVAARGMLAQEGGGRIFNILGGGSDGEYFPGMGVYGTTKRGLDYLTTALARELAGTPVLVGKVRPGMIVTEGVIREIKADPANFQRSRRIMNTLCDLPDTVAPYLVEQMLAMKKNGSKIAWLSGGKIAQRFLMARLRPRADLFAAAGL